MCHSLRIDIVRVNNWYFRELMDALLIYCLSNIHSLSIRMAAYAVLNGNFMDFYVG